MYRAAHASVSLNGEIACERCGSRSRIGRGLCLSCLLQAGSGEAELRDDGTGLAALLNSIDVQDADWRLGNYQILEEIGRGGMGVIYRARQRHSRRIVALKRVLSYHADSRETLARFRREAEAAASLDHPNILPIYEVSESEDGLPFFSMKFAGGGSLLDARESLRSNPREVVRLMAKITRAVQYAHSQGILHRDLKPGNILLDGRGEPLVSDFGLAKWLDTSSDLTRTLTIFGTPGYIAPEQAQGRAQDLTPAADIYSLGAILFDLLTGRPPFLGDHALAVIKQADEKPAPKLRSLVPGANRDLETICAKCLERDPRARYQSAHDLATDFERFLEGRSIVARPVSLPTKSWRWARRNPALAATMTILAVAVSVGGIWLAQNRELRTQQVKRTALAHSICVAPLLDLDTAEPDLSLAEQIEAILRPRLLQAGPSRSSLATSASALGTAGFTSIVPSEDGEASAATLQGTKRKRGEKVRIALRLLRNADRTVLFRKIFECEPSQIESALADPEVARAIYNALSDNSARHPASEEDPAWKSPEARALLTAGQTVMQRRTLIDIDRAIECYRKALAAQPASALALSNLAVASCARMNLDENPEYLESALHAAEQAAQINPALAEAHNALSMVLFRRGDLTKAIDEVSTAYELSEDEGRLLNKTADIWRSLGHPARALRWFRLVEQRSNRPGLGEFSIGDCLTDLTEDEAAAAAYSRAAELAPELPEGPMGLCRIALLNRQFDKAASIAHDRLALYSEFTFAREMAAQVAFFSRNFSEAHRLYGELRDKDSHGGGNFYGAVSYESALGYLESVKGNRFRAEELLRSSQRREQQHLSSSVGQSDTFYRLAAIESSLGDNETAAKHLASAIEMGWIDYRSLELDPRFDNLRSDEKFSTLLATLIERVSAERALLGHTRQTREPKQQSK